MIVLGALLPRLTGVITIGPQGLEAQLSELQRDVGEVRETVSEVRHTVDALLVHPPRIDSKGKVIGPGY